MNAAPNRTLSGQSAIVTGASSGIGKGCALAFGQAGVRVCVNYAGNRDGADEVVAAIRAAGGTAFAFECDVSNEAQVEAMFAEVVRQFNTVDILINNAGLQSDAPLTEMTLAQWNKVISVNLTGQFLCARAAVREFKRRGPRPDVSSALGKIICMSSVHQVIPWAGHVNYASSKGGINMMMQSMAQELAPLKIRINSICPGAIQTPINRDAWTTPDELKSLLSHIPYGRIGVPEDIARVALFLASDDSDYITGQSIFVDGGMTLYPEFATGG